MSDVLIRPATMADADALWAMLEPVIRAGDTYTFDRDLPRDAALAYWMGPGRHVFLAELQGTPLGTHYIVANQKGGGSHVCNCGFVTASQAQGKGVARAMLNHALDTAPQLGFLAMQFNFVVSTNTRAVEIWQRAGFDVVGRLPKAFNHPEHGFVDALVMYKTLDQAE